MHPPRPHRVKAKQRGVALMIMLVIMVVGATTVLVNSLTSSTVKTARQETTAAALAQARDALIGQAASDTAFLGSLPCPDTDNDGDADSGGNGIDCSNYIGRLPWKTLGLPDLRDAAGERLWYTLSRNVRRYVSVLPLNSETMGTLNITGAYTTNNLMAIVFAPGTNIGTQSRSNNQTAFCTTTDDTRKESLCAVNYLEGSNANLSKGASPNLDYQNANSAVPFNDQLISISHDQFFPAVEMRIAREAKACLDSYAASSANKYPWAAPVSDLSYTGTFDILFGRLSNLLPNINTSSSTDSTMSSTWTPTCTALFSSPYWADWKELVFYQVSAACQPGSTNCNTAADLSISGSGTYRAAVLVARRAIGTQVRTNPATDPPTPYLEGINQHSGSTPATTFETYNPSDLNYSTVNDLVLCLDGKNNCK